MTSHGHPLNITSLPFELDSSAPSAIWRITLTKIVADQLKMIQTSLFSHNYLTKVADQYSDLI